MTTQQQEIRFESEEHFNGRLPIHNLGFLFSDIARRDSWGGPLVAVKTK